jgi:hypothetical protein
MDSRPSRYPRRLRRLLGRLTAASLGVAAPGAADAAVPVDSMTRGGAATPDFDVDDDRPSHLRTSDDLGDDDGDPRHVAAAHWLAVSLERMSPLAQTYTACRWALSDDPEQRVTLAGALEWTFHLLGDSIIVDHLSRDVEPRVRAAAARAAWARHTSGVGADVLARLAADPEPEVREIARLATHGR